MKDTGGQSPGAKETPSPKYGPAGSDRTLALGVALDCRGILFLLATASQLAAADLTPSQTQFFENKIRPILAINCYKCHSAEAEKVKGGLWVDTRGGLLKGGESGPAISPGDPEKSLLIKAVRYTDPDLQMPLKGKKLSREQIGDLTAWVAMGAPDPRVAPSGQKGANDD